MFRPNEWFWMHGICLILPWIEQISILCTYTNGHGLKLNIIHGLRCWARVWVQWCWPWKHCLNINRTFLSIPWAMHSLIPFFIIWERVRLDRIHIIPLLVRTCWNGLKAASMHTIIKVMWRKIHFALGSNWRIIDCLRRLVAEGF